VKQQAITVEATDLYTKEREQSFERLDIVVCNSRRILLMLRGLWVDLEAGSSMEKDISVIHQNVATLLEWAEKQMAEVALPNEGLDGQKLH
jgi:hypothetical protein